MPSLTPLKKLIFEAGCSQRELADLLGIHETSFSSIVNGRLVPSDARKREIAAAISRELDRDVPVEQLWPSRTRARAA